MRIGSLSLRFFLAALVSAPSFSAVDAAAQIVRGPAVSAAPGVSAAAAAARVPLAIGAAATLAPSSFAGSINVLALAPSVAPAALSAAPASIFATASVPVTRTPAEPALAADGLIEAASVRTAADSLAAAPGASRPASESARNALALAPGGAAVDFDGASSRSAADPVPVAAGPSSPSAALAPRGRGRARAAGLFRKLAAPLALTALLAGPFSNTARASGFKAIVDGAGGTDALLIGVPLTTVLLFGAARAVYIRIKNRPATYARSGGLIERFHDHAPNAYHFWTNLTFGVLSGALSTFATARPSATLHGIINAQGWGILHHFGVVGWANVAISFVALDFYGYWSHRLYHTLPFLWRFHKVHHSDMDYDYSTYYRTHWGEDLLAFIPGMIFTALLGPTILATVIRSAFDTIWSQFQHMNVKLPRWLERFLSWFVMTSEKHYIHHSMRIEQTNSNYASTFAWDRLFGTFRQDDPDTLEAGLEEYRDPKKLGFWNLMLMPFRSTKRR